MKSVYRKTHIQARPGWQRGFLRWLQENRNQFALRPSVEKRDRINLTLRFHTLPEPIRKSIYVILNQNYIQVGVVIEEPSCNDIFFTLRAVNNKLPPRRYKGIKDYFKKTLPRSISKLPNGRYSAMITGYPFVERFQSDEYDSPESLRRAAMYSLLLDWVNTRLAPARWLGIYPDNGCMGTRIRLLPDASQLAFHVCDELNKKHNRVCPDASAKENEMQHIIPLKIKAEPGIMQLYQQALVQCSRIYSSNPQRLFGGASSLQRMLHIGYNKACVLRKLFVADQVWQAVETEQDIRYKLCGL